MEVTGELLDELVALNVFSFDTSSPSKIHVDASKLLGSSGALRRVADATLATLALCGPVNSICAANANLLPLATGVFGSLSGSLCWVDEMSVRGTRVNGVAPRPAERCALLVERLGSAEERDVMVARIAAALGVPASVLVPVALTGGVTAADHVLFEDAHTARRAGGAFASLDDTNPRKRVPFEERARLTSNPSTRALMEVMVRKESNLSVACDVNTKADLLRLADAIGPHICLLKTHIDVVDDFDASVPVALAELAAKHDFLIFEDRKFADIGNTVKQQYGRGVYHIADWSHITNAHPVPGEGIVSGLREVGQPKGRGLLLLAEMSSRGTLATGEYSVATLEMARRNRDFVMGFISQCRTPLEPMPGDDFMYLTPGVKLEAGGDQLGQQYRTPGEVVANGSDIIIVGRGVYGAADPAAAAAQYREAGWRAYLEAIA